MRKKINTRFILFFLIIFLFTTSMVMAKSEDLSKPMNVVKWTFNIIGILLVFILVILLTVYGTRFIAGNLNKSMIGKHSRVLENTNISANTKLVLVEINNYIYALVINNEAIKLIDKYEKESFNFKVSVNNYSEGKDNPLTNLIRKIIDKEDENEKKL